MYDGINNIIKVNQTREYLNQRGVSPKILLNPRSYEIIEEILEEIGFAQMNEEVVKVLNERINVEDESIELQIKDYINRKRIFKAKPHQVGIIITKEIYENGELSREKSLFNKDGIELERIYEKVKTQAEESQNSKIEQLPYEWIRIKRDEQRPDFIQRVSQERKIRIPTKKYYYRKNYLDFHNVWVNSTRRERFHLEENSIFQSLGSKEMYDFAKEEISKDNMEKGIEEYKKYNEKYGLTKRYENGIEKLCIKSKMMGGE